MAEDLYSQVQDLRAAVESLESRFQDYEDQNKNNRFDRNFSEQEIVRRIMRFQRSIYDKNGNEILGSS